MNPVNNNAEPPIVMLCIVGGLFVLSLLALLAVVLWKLRSRPTETDVEVTETNSLEIFEQLSQLTPVTVTPIDYRERPALVVAYENGEALTVWREGDTLKIVHLPSDVRLELSPERLVDIIKNVGTGRYRYREIGGAGLNVGPEDAEQIRGIFARLLLKIPNW